MINLTELLDKVKTRSLELPLEDDGTKSSKGKLRFMKKHKVEVTPDANGNGDDVFKATNVADSEEHGYNRPKGEDAKVYEEVEKSSEDESSDRLTTITNIAKKKKAQIGKTISTGSGGVGSDTSRYPAGTLKNSHEPEGEQIDEKAVSKAQQRFMGMVHAVQMGNMKNPSPEVAKVARFMKKKAAKDFASTKLTSLPDYVKENTELEYNLNKSMGLFAYINYYVESQNPIVSDFSIKERIKLAFTDFFSEIKDNQ